MGTANGGGFLGGASLTSMFSSNVNSDLYVGKVNDKNISAIPFPMLSFINWVTQKIIDKNARISLNILLNTCCYLFRKIKKNFY